ncbi:hypothetical protein MRX96_000941 [Rhipicephalus microplus]
MRPQVERLKGTVEEYKRELQKLKEDCYVPAFLQVVEQASENELAASILLEQLKNFQKVKSTWSEVTVRHAVILRNLSARAYEHLRSSGLLRLPCRSTLEHFLDSSSCSSSALLQRSARAAQNDGEAFPAETTTTLEERGKTLLPTPDVAALAMVGGYIARTVHETISCDECFTLVTKPNTSAPSDALIKHQDRGGLLYPSTELVMVLNSLTNYAEVFLARARKMNQPLKAAVDNATEILQKRDKLKCSTPGHREKLLEVLLVKFLRPLFLKFTTSVTDKHDLAKDFHVKPLSRKVLKL